VSVSLKHLVRVYLLRTTEEVDRVNQVFRASGWSEEDIRCLRGSEATVDNASSAFGFILLGHFACHAFQDSAIGMKVHLHYTTAISELGHIASKNLSNGQFAFLSACEAAAGLQDLPGEAMHLAASFQFTGFPSVIATMWSIVTMMLQSRPNILTDISSAMTAAT